MKLTKMMALPLLLMLAAPAFADSVLLVAQGDDGLDYGPSPLPVGDGLSQEFTLFAATSITDVDPDVGPLYGGLLGVVYEVSIESDSTGDIVWTAGPTIPYVLPFTLAAGTYTLSVENIACYDPCVEMDPLQFSFYFGPADDIEIGGSINPATGVGANGWGWAISGTTVPPSAVPEPGAETLVGSGLLGLAGIARRRFWRNT